jgi:quercetin dioxygenase-like cupin family protein
MTDVDDETTSIVLIKTTSSWNDVRYEGYPVGQPELTTVRMTIPANAKLPWHSHLMPNIAYILSGELTVEERATGRTATYHAGQAFAESVGSVHRGVAGDEPVDVVVTYAGSQGQPLSVPAASEEGGRHDWDDTATGDQ